MSLSKRLHGLRATADKALERAILWLACTEIPLPKAGRNLEQRIRDGRIPRGALAVAFLAIASLGAGAYTTLVPSGPTFSGPSSQAIGSEANAGKAVKDGLGVLNEFGEKYHDAKAIGGLAKAEKEAARDIPQGMTHTANVYFTPDGKVIISVPAIGGTVLPGDAKPVGKFTISGTKPPTAGEAARARELEKQKAGAQRVQSVVDQERTKEAATQKLLHDMQQAKVDPKDNAARERQAAADKAKKEATDRSAADKARADKAAADKAKADNAAADKAKADKAAADKPKADRPGGDKPGGDKGGKGGADKPGGDKPGPPDRGGRAMDRH